jgi:thioredoxin reductase (NADPH)
MTPFTTGNGSTTHTATVPVSADPTVVSTRVVRCDGTDHLERVTLLDDATGVTEEVDAEHLFVFIGATPPTEWLPEEIRRDDDGFVLSGPDLTRSGVDAGAGAGAVPGAVAAGWDAPREPYLLESSVPGVFVAGDVRSQSIKRVASAVGEGALVVALVHRYLEGR